MGCDVFKRVQEEEGAAFRLLVPDGAHHSLFEQFAAIVSIVESMNAVVYVADLDTHEILFLNLYAEKLFGNHAVGKRCFEVLQKGQTGPCGFCTNERLVVDGRPAPPVVWEFQNTVTRRWFQCIDRAIRWWDGRLVRMEVAFDITDRKAADLFREQYVGVISHDLRNPLNAILLHAQGLRRSLRKAGFGESEGLEQLIASAGRMDAMIADLLETTRLESAGLELHVQPLDLRPWVAGVVARVTPVPERHRVSIGSERESVTALADPNRLERVLENLVSNALKYSGDKPVDVVVRQDARQAVVSVIDRGMGIAPEDMPNLFQRFYRAARVGAVKGLGLGLYNARLIVEAHGGRIWAESEAGHGAEFHFALPLVAVS